MKRPTTLAFLLFAVPLASASSGDRSLPFQTCLSSCKQHTCISLADRIPDTLPFALRLTRWTCPDDCAYNCMHQVTDVAVAEGRPVLQYYGKWPFWRLFGMQEPASVLFSVLNFWVHFRGFKSVDKLVPEEHPIKFYLVLWSFVSMNAWICSAVFHIRDTRSTEKLDYFSAALVFIVALHTVASRFFFIGRPSRRILFKLWTVLCIIVYLLHVSYLTLLPRFDYSYNIIFNLVLGLSHNFLWLLYSLPSSFTLIRRFPPSSVPRDYRPRFAWKAALGVALTMAAMSLELLDFSPIGRILDAHALWHASTVPIAELWYRFLVEDALDVGWKVEKI